MSAWLVARGNKFQHPTIGNRFAMIRLFVGHCILAELLQNQFKQTSYFLVADSAAAAFPDGLFQICLQFFSLFFQQELLVDCRHVSSLP